MFNDKALINRYWKALEELAGSPDPCVRMFASELLGSIRATMDLSDLYVLMDPKVQVFGVEMLVRLKVRRYGHG